MNSNSVTYSIITLNLTFKLIYITLKLPNRKVII